MKVRIPLCRVLVAVLSLLPVTSPAQRFEKWQHFTSRSGLVQNSVLHMERDSGSYLWISSEGGLLRFDGRAFRSFALPSADEPTSQRMRQVIPTFEGEVVIDDADGNVYGTHAHLAVFPLVRSTRDLHIQGSVPDENLFARVRASARAMVRASEWQIPNATWHALTEEEWLVTTPKACFHFKDTLLEAYVPWEVELETSWWFGGRHYGGTGTGQYYRLDPSTGACDPVAMNGAPNDLLSIKNRFERLFWHAGDLFLHVIHNGVLYRLEENRNNGSLVLSRVDVDLPRFGGNVSEILFMPEVSTLFIGTLNDGLMEFRPFPMRSARCDNFFAEGSSLYAQTELPDGGVLVAGQARESYRIQNGSCSPYPELERISKYSMANWPGGRVWLLSKTDLILYDPNTRRVEVRILDVGQRVAMLAEGDSLIYATNTMIRSWRAGKIRTLSDARQGSGLERPYVLKRDANGRLMFGTFKGLRIQQGDDPGAFRSIPELNGMNVRSLELIDDLLFIGTYGSGAFIRVGDRIVPFPMDPWKSLSHVHTFAKDGNGHLWMSTNQGLLRTTMADITTYLSSPDDRPYFALYGESSGLPTWEMNGGCDPAYLRLSDGRFSFPTIQGLIQFVPERIQDPFPTSEIQPGHILVNGSRWSLDKELILPHDVASLSMGFSMPYWGDPVNALLEYRIPGIVDMWTLVEPSARSIDIIRPPAGDFTIYVRRVGSTARGLTTEPMLWFRVEPPFSRTWQALILYVIATLAMIALGVRINSARVRNRTIWLERNVQEQTEALMVVNAELKNAITHQEKLMSIIAHDVVPPMRFVARVAQSAKELHERKDQGGELAATLSDLSTYTDKLYQNANSLLAWIRSRSRKGGPEVRSIAVHAFIGTALDRISELAAAAGTDLVNAVDPDDVIKADGDLLRIVLNNVLMNATSHARAKCITVTSQRKGHFYHLTISDDGVGIAGPTLERIHEELEGRSGPVEETGRGAAVGLGFVIMAECMRTLNGTMNVESSASGTRISVVLPGPR